MRILHVDKLLDPRLDGAGGVRRHVADLTTLQRRRGHEVLHFGCAGPGGPRGWPRYRDFRGAGALSLPGMIHNREAAARLDRLLVRRRPDVAHLHNIYHHLTPSILPALARRGIAVVMTVHDYRLGCPARHLWRRGSVPGGEGYPCRLCLPGETASLRIGLPLPALGRTCGGLRGAGPAVETFLHRAARSYFRHVARFLCPSRFAAELLLRIGAPRSKVALARLPVPPVRLPGVVHRRARELLYAGRLSEEKGVGLLLDAGARLPDARFVLAGDGPLTGTLRARARNEGLENVVFTGWVGREELARRLAAATLAVLPSVGVENAPLAMIEAMSAGRCVLAADQPAVREWIRDGRSGGLFAAGNAAALVSRATKLLADEVGRTRMEQAAVALAARRHDPDRTAERIEQLYAEAIAQCGSR